MNEMDVSQNSLTPPKYPCRYCYDELILQQPIQHVCECRGSLEVVCKDCLIKNITRTKSKQCELCHKEYKLENLLNAQEIERVSQIIRPSRGIITNIPWHRNTLLYFQPETRRNTQTSQEILIQYLDVMYFATFCLFLICLVLLIRRLARYRREKQKQPNYIWVIKQPNYI